MTKYRVVDFNGKYELEDLLNQFAENKWEIERIYPARASMDELNCIGFVVFKKVQRL